MQDELDEPFTAEDQDTLWRTAVLKHSITVFINE